MKRSRVPSSITSIFKSSLRRAALSLRRFRKRGGIGGFFGRLFMNLKKGNRRAIAGCAAFTGALVLVICLPLVIKGGKAEPQSALPVAEASAASADGVVDLQGEYAAMLERLAAAEPTPAPTPVPIFLQEGYDGDEIYDIQERLMELSYMDNDEPTNHFGPATEEAVELFQRRHELTIDGIITNAVYDLLFSDEALKYMVCVGISGTDVYELQGRLRELGYMDKATGNFGEETEAAVKEFQKNNKLTVDGKVGEYTREMLYSEDAVPKSLSYGEKSDEVRSYQKRLYRLGYLTTEPDGTFGRDTVNAVKMFQQQNGLIVDGHIGPMTKDLLMSDQAKASVIGVGDNNSTVTKIQNRLKELGYLDSKATGYFGSSTEAAVLGFQKENGLSRDGKVGKTTMRTLFSSGAKSAPSDYVEPEVDSSGSASSSGSGSSSPSSGGSLDRFISAAKSKLGCKYVRGGKGPNTFDCSGFVYWCLQQAGVNQKYLTSSGWRSVSGYTKVRSISSLQKGDIIVFYGHVGIAMGDGTMIDASSTNGKVVHRSCTGAWSQKNFICGWRVF